MPSLLPILATKFAKTRPGPGGGAAGIRRGALAITQAMGDGCAMWVILPCWRSACAAHDVIAERLERGAGGGVGQPGDLGPGGPGPAPQVAAGRVHRRVGPQQGKGLG